MKSLILAAVITYHSGGTGAEANRLSRQPLVIDGPCLSACSWGFITNRNACFTKRARFWFHEFRDPGTGAELPAATKYWLDKSPAWVKPGMRLTAKQMAEREPKRACR